MTPRTASAVHLSVLYTHMRAVAMMHKTVYRIAGNFRGRILSRIGREGAFRGMLKLHALVA